MKSKEQKPVKAAERQAEHDRLSAVGKLGKLAGRPGESKRERARRAASAGERHVSLAFKIAVEQYHAVRDEYEVVLIAAYERAVGETNGAMMNRRGEVKGISHWDLFTHNGLFAQAHASEELIEHWATCPRPTFVAFERQMLFEGWC